MAEFYAIHRPAIERASHHAKTVGEHFRITMQEPLGPVSGGQSRIDQTETIVTFIRTTRDGRYRPASPGDESAIEDWNKRHAETPPSAWDFPF